MASLLSAADSGRVLWDGTQKPGVLNTWASSVSKESTSSKIPGDTDQVVQIRINSPEWSRHGLQFAVKTPGVDLSAYKHLTFRSRISGADIPPKINLQVSAFDSAGTRVLGPLVDLSELNPAVLRPGPWTTTTVPLDQLFVKIDTRNLGELVVAASAGKGLVMNAELELDDLRLE